MPQNAEETCDQTAHGEANTDNEIDGFGCFDEDETESQETNLESSQSQNISDDIEGFGLFEDEATSKETQAKGEANTKVGVADEGFGFFEPDTLPVKTWLIWSANW